MAAASAGGLFALAFPWWEGVYLEPLAWGCLLPLLWALETSGSVWGALGVSLVFAGAAQLGCIAPSVYLKGGSTLLLMLNAPGIAVPSFLYFLIRQYVGPRWGLAAFPFIWASWEWWHTTYSALNAPWLAFGASQSRLLDMIQFIEWTGVWGLSAWLVLLNVSLFIMWRVTPWRWHGVMFTAVCLVLPLVGSQWILLHADQQPVGEHLDVLAIQPGLLSTGDGSKIARSEQLTQTALARQSADLVLWPEGAAMRPVLYELPVRNSLLEQVREWGVPLMLVAMDVEAYSATHPAPAFALRRHEPLALYNADALLTPELASYVLTSAPDTSLPIRMDRKRRLVPFVEHLPFMEYSDVWVRWFDKLQGQESSWFTSGNSPPEPFALLHHGQVVRVGGIVCFEMLFPNELAQLVSNGAQVLMWLTNDQQAQGGVLAYQFAQFGRLRAIETRRYVVRVNDDGNSFSLDPWGRESAVSPRGEPGFARFSIALRDDRTFYVRHPDDFPRLAVLVVGLMVAGGIARKWF